MEKIKEILQYLLMIFCWIVGIFLFIKVWLV